VASPLPLAREPSTRTHESLGVAAQQQLAQAVVVAMMEARQPLEAAARLAVPHQLAAAVLPRQVVAAVLPRQVAAAVVLRQAAALQLRHPAWPPP